MDSKDEIFIVAPNEEDFGENRDYIPFPVEELSSQLSEFQKKLSRLFGEMIDTESAFSLDQITINAEISTEGKVGFLGSGVKGGAKGGITFTFSRKEAK